MCVRTSCTPFALDIPTCSTILLCVFVLFFFYVKVVLFIRMGNLSCTPNEVVRFTA